MNKYEILEGLIKQWLNRAKEDYEEARKIGGVNCTGACIASGAIDAYNIILNDIQALKREFRIGYLGDVNGAGCDPDTI